MVEQKTEAGFNISKYIEERNAGMVKIFKPLSTSGNYIITRSQFVAQIVNGHPTLIESTPETKNINRQSLLDMRAVLMDQEAEIAKTKLQLDAIESDMNILDAAIP